ncbi:unnamed protein product [Jaminaea pallidilutea]
MTATHDRQQVSAGSAPATVWQQALPSSMQTPLSALLLIAIALAPLLARADCRTQQSCISGPGFVTTPGADVCRRKAGPDGSVIRACFSTEDQVLVATSDCGGVQSSCRFDFTTEGNRIEYIEGGVMCYFEGNKNEVVGPRTTKIISNQVRGVNARMECVSGRRE